MFDRMTTSLTPILRALVAQYNPWLSTGRGHAEAGERYLPSILIARRAAPELADALGETGGARLVVGPRQAGKSTLAWSVLTQCERPLLYLNCEEPIVREWCRSPGLFLAELGEFLPKHGVLFLEEAQWLDEAGLFVKGIVDARMGRTVLVTGSASFHLLARTRESLAGRAGYHTLWPLSLDEAAPLPDDLIPAGRFERRRAAMERMLVWGGYPGVWTSDEPAAELNRIVTAFVLRDASDRFRIERPDAFRKLLSLCAGQVGDLANYSEWGRILGIATTTVSDYCALLEESHVLRLLRPYIGGRRAELTQTPKTYFIDNGLRNRLRGGFEPLDGRSDIGKLLENWTFSELHKRFPEPGALRYWRTRGGAEVDFILEPTPGELIGIEVKATTSRRPHLTRSARAFIDAYEPSQLWVLHRGEAHARSVGGVEVQWLPAHQLPDRLATLPRG